MMNDKKKIKMKYFILDNKNILNRGKKNSIDFAFLDRN